ncbi:MAG: transposase [Rikenellaceae bacterium]
MYDFTRTYLNDVFVNLPSYVAICNRIARLAPAFVALYEHIAKLNIESEEYLDEFSLMDSMPIVTCSGKSQGKVAREITNKGYCSTKSMYFYGLKLHALAYHKSGTLPILESMIVSPASESDLYNRILVADKIYQDAENESFIFDKYNSYLLSPVKYPRGVEQETKQRNRVADDLYNRSVSSVRQPIESLFNGLIERTNIQRASKIRSTARLISFIFGKLAAAFLLFKSFKP